MEWIEEVERWRKEYVESIELPDLAALPFPEGWERGDYKDALWIKNEALRCGILIEHQDPDKRFDKESETDWYGKRYWAEFWRHVVEGELDGPYDPSRQVTDGATLCTDDWAHICAFIRHRIRTPAWQRPDYYVIQRLEKWGLRRRP